MTTFSRRSITRRSATVLGAVTFGSMMAQPTSAHHSAVDSGGGLVGGGAVVTESVRADFSLFASRFQLHEDGVFFLGRFNWFDAAWEDTGLRIDLTELTNYGPVEGLSESTRELEGLVTVNDTGPYPMVMRVVDGGEPGDEADSLTLRVGTMVTMDESAAINTATPIADEDFSYEVSGVLTHGDLSLVSFDFPEL